MSSKSRTLITSALPYVNNEPHLGNIIGCVLSADVYARFLRKCGEEVLFACGTDEYGTTTEIKALQENITCREICDKYHELHKKIYKWFNISFDVFGRTTTDTHTKTSQDIFIELWRKGYIIEKEITQYKCMKCNMFLADRYIKAKCYYENCNGIANGDQCDDCQNLLDTDKITEFWCSVCSNTPIKEKTKHLFLKMDKFQNELKKQILNNPSVHLTDNARAITKSWLDKGLEDRCITRDLKWGTPVPYWIDGLHEYKNKVFYVWFDAPIGYLSIIQHNREDHEYWLENTDKNKELRWVQFMAKDNVPFHTIIFPATLIGSNLGYNMMTDLSCTEYLNYEDKKFSKSKGIGVFGNNAKTISQILNIDEDYWRYYLIKIRPQTSDSSFNWKEFTTVIKSELAQKIGNFINRCMSMTEKNYSNKTKLIWKLDNETYEELTTTFDNFIILMKNYKLMETIRLINKIAEIGNTYINAKEVYNECKKDLIGSEYHIGNILYIAWLLGEIMELVMPNKSKQIKQHIIYKTDKVYQVEKNGEIEYAIDGYTKIFNQVKIEDIENALKLIGIV